ncbi:MAG: hypothetical protein ACK5O2_00770 [Microthrixaceae bacterium]
MFVFVAATAGVVAQVLVMLLLAVAFTTRLRGAWRYRETVGLYIDSGTQVAIKNHRYAQAGATFWAAAFGVLVMLANLCILVLGEDLEGALGYGIAGASILAAVWLSIMLLWAIWAHHKHSDTTAHN